jgi:protein TonB
MRLRSYHIAGALVLSLAAHAGAVGWFTSGEEPTLLAGGGPVVSAELGQVFVDAIQAGNMDEGEEVGEVKPEEVQPVDAPEADKAREESTALVESLEPEASDPTPAPEVEEATEVSAARPVQEATVADQMPADMAVPELTASVPAEIAYADATVSEPVSEVTEAVQAAPAEVAETAPTETVEAAVVEAAPTPRGRPKDLKIAEVKREAPARKAKEVKRRKEKPARARKAGGQKGAGGQSNATASRGGASRAGRTSEMGNADVSNYRGLVQRKLERARRRSRDAGNRRGTVTVYFVVQTSGSVSAISIRSSSGDPVLDRVAVKMVQKAAPFPPIPAGAGRRTWPFTVPIAYN